MKQHKWHKEPLTLEQIRSLYHKQMAETNVNVSFWDFKKIVPTIEKAHGIGEDK